MNKFEVMADIRIAFLRTRLQENNEDYLRFVWCNKNYKLKYFRKFQLFGILGSPLLLKSVVQNHLKNNFE